MTNSKRPAGGALVTSVGVAFLIVGVSIVVAVVQRDGWIVAAGFGGFIVALAVGGIIDTRRR